MEWLTTGEMIDRLWVGEVAEVVSDGINKGRKLHLNEEGSLVSLFDNTTCAVLNFGCLSSMWRILPKYVSFEEARKAYEEGKKVKCDFVSALDKNQTLSRIFGKNISEHAASMSWYLITEGKWSIEEES